MDSAAVSRPRKPHQKSRAGCVRCKKRKIKCDESKPTCSNCLKHSVQCAYLAQTLAGTRSGVLTSKGNVSDNPNIVGEAPSSSHSLQATPLNPDAPVLNLLDLELLHNFSTSTCYTLQSDPSLKTLWRINIPQLGFRYDFVMRGLLALSALHLAYYKPEKRDLYVAQAKLQNQAGLRTAAAMLPYITSENCSAVYIFSVLAFFFSIAVPREQGDLLILGDEGISPWLNLFRGTRSIIESSSDALREGPLGPMFIAGSRRAAVRKAYTEDGSTMKEGQMSELRVAVRGTTTDPQALKIYMEAIDELQIAFTVPYENVFESLEGTDVFIFLFRVSGEYLQFLKERKQEALAIFAYFCVVANRLEKNWWSEGWSNHLMSRVFTLLDEEHRLWIRWPIEEIGWVPTRAS